MWHSMLCSNADCCTLLLSCSYLAEAAAKIAGEAPEVMSLEVRGTVMDCGRLLWAADGCVEWPPWHKSCSELLPANTLILMAHLPPPSTPLPEQVLEKDECEKLGMGLFLGVSEASAEPPKFIHLTYTPKGGCSWAAVVGGLAGERGRAR